MTAAFDTLAYTQKLRSAGISPEQAEAHAEALKAALAETVATKSDLKDVQTALGNDITAVRRDLKDVETALRNDLQATEAVLRQEIRAVDTALRHEIELVRKDVESLGWKLTVRLGGMIAAGVGLLIILDKWIG
jgi:hypothetical protein